MPLKWKMFNQIYCVQNRIKSDQVTMAFIGLASNTFEDRYMNHTSTFRIKNTKKVCFPIPYIISSNQEEMQFMKIIKNLGILVVQNSLTTEDRHKK